MALIKRIKRRVKAKQSLRNLAIKATRADFKKRKASVGLQTQAFQAAVQRNIKRLKKGTFKPRSVRKRKK